MCWTDALPPRRVLNTLVDPYNSIRVQRHRLEGKKKEREKRKNTHLREQHQRRARADVHRERDAVSADEAAAVGEHVDDRDAVLRRAGR